MKSRSFAFTHNNYIDTQLEDTIECKYIIYGKEVGESGTPHLQGTVVFENPRSIAAVIKLLPGCHVSVCRDVVASVAYCKKDGVWTERGVPPLSPVAAAKKGIALRWELVKEGRFDELPPENLKQYEYAKRKFEVVEDISEISNEWRWGRSGVGKSRSVRTDFPVFYSKDATKWWDNYDHQDIVLIEDWDPKTTEYLSRHLKIWSDHYAFRAECKGGSMSVRPKKIIITSQYSIADCFPDPNDYAAISRRFKSIHYDKI